MKYYVVRYSGTFGYIKPWSAVRDGETYSQQFLTPSIVEGMEKKLFPELLSTKGIHKILRHKLSSQGISVQQEKTQAQAWTSRGKAKQRSWYREQSILKRGVLLNPSLYLAFGNEKDASSASEQHICLCRNEDLLFPDRDILIMEESEFDTLKGFELRFDSNCQDAFMVGFNRFDENKPMYGSLEISGEAVLRK
ncbi:hypothetical protein [Bacteroides heparinolyticus]|uniref:hypothetical protein n=1 Tax=Prevotella heparinolytica TaxID=28113 RepID=UPI00359FBC0B